MASRVLVPHVPGQLGLQHAPAGPPRTCAAAAHRSPDGNAPAPQGRGAGARAQQPAGSPPGIKPVDPLYEDDPYKWDFLRELCQEEFGLEISEAASPNPSPPAYTYTPPARPEPIVPVVPSARPDYHHPPAAPSARAAPASPPKTPEPPVVRQTIKHETVRRSTVDLSGLNHARERFLGQHPQQLLAPHTDSRASSASTSAATSPSPTRPVSAHSGSFEAAPGAPPTATSAPSPVLSRGSVGFAQGSGAARMRASSLVCASPPPARTASQERREEQLITTYIPSSLPPHQPSLPPQQSAPPQNNSVRPSHAPPRPAVRRDEAEGARTASLRSVFEGVAAQRKSAQDSLARKSVSTPPRPPTPPGARGALVKMPSDVSSGAASDAGTRARCPDSPLSACSWGSPDAHQSAAKTAPSSPELRARLNPHAVPQFAAYDAAKLADNAAKLPQYNRSANLGVYPYPSPVAESSYGAESWGSAAPPAFIGHEQQSRFSRVSL